MPSIDFKVITDIEAGFISKETFNEFNLYGETRSLISTHAKLYIIDDECIITSANLTYNAFAKRNEIGNIVAYSEICDIFDEWWNKAEKCIEVHQMESKQNIEEYGSRTSFSTKCKLPKYDSFYDAYITKCNIYREFRQLYFDVTNGGNKKMQEKGFKPSQEVDFFFNYLYHEAEDRPSYKVSKAIHRSEKEKKNHIAKYFSKMCKYFENLSDKDGRIKQSREFAKLLSPAHILKLTKEEKDWIANCIYSLHTYGWNLNNVINTDVRTVRKAWNELLNSGDITAEKIKNATEAIDSFGKYSACELIGWYMPEKYPIMNTNSDSGMRFFGFEVK